MPEREDVQEDVGPDRTAPDAYDSYRDDAISLGINYMADTLDFVSSHLRSMTVPSKAEIEEATRDEQPYKLDE